MRDRKWPPWALFEVAEWPTAWLALRSLHRLPTSSIRRVGSDGSPQLAARAVLVAVSRAWVLVLVATWCIGTASAQPGRSIALTSDEQALLARGEISRRRHVLGAVGAGVFGLGTGQAIQGRWKARGWIFTVGELAAFAMIAVAAAESDLDERLVGALGIGGWTAFLGLHVWEVADAIVVPGRHNRRVRDLRVKVGIPIGTASLLGNARGGHGEPAAGAVVELSVRF